MDTNIAQLQEYAARSDTVVTLTWAWNMSDGGKIMHGIQLMGPRKKKLGPFLAVHDPHPNTPVGALRSLADLLEVKD